MANPVFIPDVKTYYKTREQKTGDAYVSIGFHEKRDNPRAPWIVQVFHGTWAEQTPEPKTYKFTTYNEAEQAFKEHCERAKEKFPVDEGSNPIAFLDRQ